MASLIRKVWPRPGFARLLVTFQLIFLAVAIALFALVEITGWRNGDFAGILLFSFCAGNLTLQGMRLLYPLYSRRSAAQTWLIYVPLLFLVAVVSSILSVLLIMAVYRNPLSAFRPIFWGGGRMGVLVIMIVGVVQHLYADTRARLEKKNAELQHSVEAEKSQTHLQEQDLEKAREIQEGLLPKLIPQVRGLEVAGAWMPARIVGGDYYDVLRFSEDKIGICIGDVVGKGITAALLMANLQATLRAFASEAITPATLCQKLNEVICNNSAADKFVTFCYCTIEPGERKLRYANAGHWPPILLRKSGTRVTLEAGGFPLGIYPETTYTDAQVQLESGDRLIMYTDGVTEAANVNNQELGEPGLIVLGRNSLALNAAELLETITSEVSAFNHGSFQDDFTLVVVAVK